MIYDNKYTPSAPVSATPQNIILENRGRLSVTGVTNVINYDDTSVLMDTCKGLLRIRGENLHITKLTLETGDAAVDGTVDSLVYENSSDDKGGFFSRLFR